MATGHKDLSWECRRHVANMSARHGDVGRLCQKRHVTATRHGQNEGPTHPIHINNRDMFKSAQTYICSYYHTFFVFELKQHANMSGKCRQKPTCRQMLCRLVPLADMQCRRVADMTKDMLLTCHRHDTPCWQTKAREDTTQNDIPC